MRARLHAVDWGTLVAGYAAGVSTIVGVRQVLSELPRVKVKAQYGMKVFTPGISDEEDVFCLTVTNAGRRPVLITQVAFLHRDRGWIALPGDWLHRGEIPFSLGEGQYKSLLLHYRDFTKEERPLPPEGSVWFVSDSVGRTWPRRAIIRLRRRRIGNWWRKKTKGEDPWEAARHSAADGPPKD